MTDTKHEIQAGWLLVLLGSKTPVNGAPFTVQSKKTGKDYTFKIKRSEFLGRLLTHVYVEQGYLEFAHLGTWTIYRGITKKAQHVESPAAKAAEWLLRNVENCELDKVDRYVNLFHLGKCLRCGKTLTDADSIQTGLGPICRGK